MNSRTVRLRDEHQGDDTRSLWAYRDEDGQLNTADVPRVASLLGGEPGTDVLDPLERDWTGSQSYEVEARLRHSDIPVQLHTWGG
jgi:hypothetical protein